MGVDQGELDASCLFLALSFARDHICGSVEPFDVDQSRYPLFFGEAFDQSELVLEGAAVEIIRQTDVEHFGFAAHDVEVIAAANRRGARGTARDPSLRSG
jgi:hypothetical protein